MGAASTSSTVMGWRRRASGLCPAWRRFFTEICAIWTALVPCSCMWRMARRAKLAGVTSPSRVSISSMPPLSRPSPGTDIFSAPTTMAISHSPAAIAVRARYSALEPEVQAFSTFTTGTRRIPSWASTSWPSVMSPVSRLPSVLAKNPAPIRAGSIPASRSASRAASRASSASPASLTPWNGVIPAPSRYTPLTPALRSR